MNRTKFSVAASFSLNDRTFFFNSYVRTLCGALSLALLFSSCSATAPVSANKKALDLIEHYEQSGAVEDLDLTSGKVDDAYDLIDQLEGTDKEKNAIKLKIAKAYEGLFARNLELGKFARARILCERAAKLESSVTTEPSSETHAGHLLSTLDQRADSEEELANKTANSIMNRDDHLSERFYKVIKDHGANGRDDSNMKELLRSIEFVQHGFTSDLYRKTTFSLVDFYERTKQFDKEYELFEDDAEKTEKLLGPNLQSNPDPKIVTRLSEDLDHMIALCTKLKRKKDGIKAARKAIDLDRRIHARSPESRAFVVSALAQFHEMTLEPKAQKEKTGK